jgi:hypothetical protein
MCLDIVSCSVDMDSTNNTPACQYCHAGPATRVYWRTDDGPKGYRVSLALACSDTCNTYKPSVSNAEARETFGFLVDRNVIPLLKPHAGMIHQYIAYKGCRVASARMNLPVALGAAAYWASFSPRWPRMTVQRFMAGLVWPDMPLATLRLELDYLTTDECANLCKYLQRSLTRKLMDTFSDMREEAYVASVSSAIDIPYLSAPDAEPFRVEPSPSWAISFGAAITFPDLLFPTSVEGQNAVMLHKHPAMAILHMMRGSKREKFEAALSRARIVFTYLFERFAQEGDAFLLGILVHAASDSFSLSHAKRNPRFPCQLEGLISIDEEPGGEAETHASREGVQAVFADAKHEIYTEAYAQIMPAVQEAVGFLFWSAAHVLRTTLHGTDASMATWNTSGQQNNGVEHVFHWPKATEDVRDAVVEYFFRAFCSSEK